MSFYQHTRSLGKQPGTQLNQTRDGGSASYQASPADRVFAVAGKFTRGRIDAPFRVNRSNLSTMLGPPQAMRISSLNEPYIQAYEALNNGASEAIVSRITTTAAVNSYAIFNIAVNVSAFTINATAPSTGYLFYLQHLGCFNDGLRLEVRAERAFAADGITPAANKMITLTVREPNGTLMYEFYGSLDPASINDAGQDNYIGTAIASQTADFSIVTAANASIPATADCYGRNADGSQKYVTSGANPIILFSEGGTAYQATDFDRVIAGLENGPHDFSYMISGGTTSVTLLSKLAALAIRANRQFIFDVPGNLSAAAAIAFVGQLNLDSHLVQCYWAPLTSTDPVNGGIAVIGTSGLNVGMRCARNALTNAHDIAPKNYPVAGKEFPIARTNITQTYFPNDVEASDLAAAKINPVGLRKFSGGSRFVFVDSITLAKTDTSQRKLIATAEMCCDIENSVAAFGNEVIQLPMAEAIRRMGDFLSDLLKNCKAANWIIPSDDPALGDAGYAFSVKPNAARPYERMDVDWGVHFDGTARAIFITPKVFSK